MTLQFMRQKAFALPMNASAEAKTFPRPFAIVVPTRARNGYCYIEMPSQTQNYFAVFTMNTRFETVAKVTTCRVKEEQNVQAWVI